MKAVVSEKGQVTIPKALRERLGIRTGQVLEFVADHGRLVAVKVPTESPLDSVYGILKAKHTTDQIIEELRGEPDEL